MERIAATLPLAGLHNLRNALGAAAAACAAGAPIEQIVVGLAAMKTVAGRLELKPAINGAFIVDDSYNANPARSRRASTPSRGFAGTRWLVLGEMKELGDSERRTARRSRAAMRARPASSDCWQSGEGSRFSVEAFGPGGRWFADHRRVDPRSASATDQRRRGAHQRVAGEPAGAGVRRALRLAVDFHQRTLKREQGTGRMLLYLTKQLALLEGAFRVFQYLTLRAILAALTALLISFIVGPWMIRKLSTNQIGQRVRDDGPKSHLPKAGTPTMGGLLILVAITFSTLLWADLSNRFVWVRCW